MTRSWPALSFWLVVCAAILLGAALHSRSLETGYAAEDFLHMAMVEGKYPVERSSLDLYCFANAARGELSALRARGVVPWWSHPELRACALRPLSSLLVALEHGWLELGAAARHALSLLWWVALMLAFASFAAKVGSARAAAVGVAIFALDPAHVLPVGWLANRATLVSSTFAVLALRAHLVHRAGGRRQGVLGALFWTLALLGGEYGFAAAFYVVGYEIAVSGDRSVRRGAVLAPALIPASIYTVFYFYSSYGARGSAVYLFPTERPLAWAWSAPGRWSSLVAEDLLLLPSEFGAAGWAMAVVLLAAVALGVSRRLLPSGSVARTRVVGLLLGAALSLLPLLAVEPHSRLLVVPSVGTSIAIGMVLDAAWPHRRSRWVAGAALLAVVHLLLAPVMTWLRLEQWRGFRALTDRVFASAPRAAHEADRVGVLQAANVQTLVYPPFFWEASRGTRPRWWHVLSTGAGGVQVARPDARSLEVAAPTALFADSAARLFRSEDAPFKEGDRVRLPGLEITIVEARAGAARRVRYRFERPVDGPELVLLLEAPGELSRVPVPGIGGSTRLLP